MDRGTRLFRRNERWLGSAGKLCTQKRGDGAWSGEGSPGQAGCGFRVRIVVGVGVELVPVLVLS